MINRRQLWRPQWLKFFISNWDGLSLQITQSCMNKAEDRNRSEIDLKIWTGIGSKEWGLGINNKDELGTASELNKKPLESEARRLIIFYTMYVVM